MITTHNRALTPEEIRRIAENPYCLLQRASVTSTALDPLHTAKDTVNWFAGEVVYKIGGLVALSFRRGTGR